MILEYNYCPIILKKFAYASAWIGIKDFRSILFKCTEKPIKKFLLDENFELDVPSYTWDKRIRFSVGKEHKRFSIFSTPVLKSSRKHKSQKAGIIH